MKHLITVLLLSLIIGLAGCKQSGSQVIFGEGQNKLSTLKGQVEVKDNILTLSGGDAEVLLKGGDYTNFILTAEIRTQNKGKGAIWFHTDPALDKGYSIAINNDFDDPVWWKMTGSLVSVRNLPKSFVRDDEWFTLQIKVEGQLVYVTVNGTPIVEYIEPQQPWRTAEHANTRLSKGTFAFQSTGTGTIQYRDIHVEALEPKGIDLAQQAMAVNEQEDEIIRLHQEDFPVLDYHVHLKGGLTREVAASQSRRLGINYAIAPNCGIGFPITDDKGIYAFLDEMRSEPFILAMQAEGREWLTTFSQEARDEFDYVFTDALTFTDNKGRRSRIWVPSQTFIEDEQEYMDMLVDKICDVLKEPVDIYVNPCYLPDAMNDRYDEFWTEARIDRFVSALKESGKALEINELYEIPSKAILLKAKAAGVKFTFGSNNVTPDVSDLSYSIRMKKECGLTAQDMYKPKIKL